MLCPPLLEEVLRLPAVSFRRPSLTGNSVPKATNARHEVVLANRFRLLLAKYSFASDACPNTNAY